MTSAQGSSEAIGRSPCDQRLSPVARLLASLRIVRGGGLSGLRATLVISRPVCRRPHRRLRPDGVIDTPERWFNYLGLNRALRCLSRDAGGE